MTDITNRTIMPPDEPEETGPAISPLRAGQDPQAIAVASQWQLIRKKFFRNKVAVAAGVIVLLLYLVAAFVEFLAPTSPTAAQPRFTYAPPQAIHLFITDEDDGRRFLPHVKGYKMSVDPASLRRTFTVDEEKVIPIGFFVKGTPYEMWGLIPWDRHFIGATNPKDTVNFLGTDGHGNARPIDDPAQEIA
ncbi:MAG: ABC transporter permease, partial [Pseudomonadota bacterium]